MTKKEKELLKDVSVLIGEAKMLMSQAEDRIEEAADKCAKDQKTVFMEDQLNSIFDELTDLRFDLGKQLKNFEERLNGEGDEAPESWSA